MRHCKKCAMCQSSQLSTAALWNGGKCCIFCFGKITTVSTSRQLKNFQSRDRENLNDPASNLTVNVTFIPVTRNNEMPTLYYIGIFGTASEYHTKEEETFLGVNITHVIGKESSCTGFDSSGNCLVCDFDFEKKYIAG